MQTTDMPVISVGGDPLQRGRIHGESARDAIADVIGHWVQSLGALNTKSGESYSANPDLSWRSFIENTHFLKAIQQWAPELLEEIKGIAEGANQPFEKILALQLIDEEWVYGLQQQKYRPSQKCTAFGISTPAGTVTYAGQNMDVPHWMEGFQTVLRIQHNASNATSSKPVEALVFTVAGIIGLKGINSAPLGITCNTLAQLKANQQGLPVSVIVRKVLSMGSLSEAESFLKGIPHASGQNYILSTHGQARCFECSATQVVDYQPHQATSVAHTNHPLQSNDINDWADLVKPRLPNSSQRLISMNAHLAAMLDKPTVDKLKQALSSHDDPNNPVCRCNKHGISDQAIGFTAGSSIYEFGDRIQLHLAAGPPCSTQYITFGFEQGESHA